jgi:hypothetical protein
MRNSDRAWVALAGGVAAYDLIATDDEQLTYAARRYFKSQPIATVLMILVTGLHLVGGIPRWCDPFTLSFNGYRRLLVALEQRRPNPSGSVPMTCRSALSAAHLGDGLALAHDGSCCGS